MRFSQRSGIASAALCLLVLAPFRASLARKAGSQSSTSAADTTLERISRITGLPIKAPLKTHVVSRAEVQKYLTENVHTNFTPQELHVQEATLKAFGLAERDFDLEKFLVSFYTEQAAGFYDPKRKTMFMANWVNQDMQRMVLAHELTHALQDQNFDLEKFLHETKHGNDDAANARQAVVEGYATTAMLQDLMAGVDLAGLPSIQLLMEQVIHQQFEEFPVFNKAPFFFRFQALFPYSAGMGFVQRGLAKGGWKKVNEVFSNPPASTREVFEPQAYFEHRSAPEVSLPRPDPLASVSGLKLLDENTLGELGYYSLVGQLISEEEAQSVSTGWLADRYFLYEDPAAHQYALVARTRWSSPGAAQAFFRDYRAILDRKYPSLSPDKRSRPDLFIGSTASGEVILLRKGDECPWAEGVPAAQTESMLDYLETMNPRARRLTGIKEGQPVFWH